MNKVHFLTAEAVRAGHPDKLCDQIADCILDAHLLQDPYARVAVEVFATDGKILVAGEVTSKAVICYKTIVWETLRRIGYGKRDLCSGEKANLDIEVRVHEQSPDISQAVGKGDEQGAGDQGIMVGYATDETPEYLPTPVVLAQRLCRELDKLQDKVKWLGADGKVQVTVAYEDGVPKAVTNIVISVQHVVKVDVVMTKSISRFARNLTDCVNCVRQLKEKAIPVLFEKEGLNSMDASCELILSVLATMAQEEVNNLSQNIRWSLNHRNASGNPSRAARYGYRKEPDEKGKKVWRIYEPEAKRVRLAFRLALQGQDYSGIVTALDNMEIDDGSDVRWTQPRVFEMLKSEVYIGDILTNKGFKPDFLSKRVVKNTGQRTQYYLEGHHEPIIDRETFERVGELINQKKLRVKKRGRSKSE